MYEDTPQDLVHDLIAEAVFGDHPLGRPVIGTERGDLERPAGRRPLLPRLRYVGPNIVVAAAGNLDHEPLVHAVQTRLLRSAASPTRRRRAPGVDGRVRAAVAVPAARTPSSSTSPRRRSGCRAPTGAGSPRRCSTRCWADRPRRACSRRSASGGGWPTRSTRTPRSTPTRAWWASTWARARTTWRSACGSSPTSSGAMGDGGFDAAELDPGQGEPEGPHHALDGVHVEPGQPARQVGADRYRAALARPHLRRDRCRRPRGDRGARAAAVRA